MLFPIILLACSKLPTRYETRTFNSRSFNLAFQISAETIEKLSKDHSRSFLREMKRKLIAVSPSVVIHKATDITSLNQCIEDSLKMFLRVARNCLIPVQSSNVMEEFDEASYRWDLYHRLPKNFLASPYIELLDHPYEPFARTPPGSIFRFEWIYPLPGFDFEEFDRCISDAEECISDSESLISSARSGSLGLPYPFHDEEYDVSVSGKPNSDDEKSDDDNHSDGDRSMLSFHDDDFDEGMDHDLFDAEQIPEHGSYSWHDDEASADDGDNKNTFPWSDNIVPVSEADSISAAESTAQSPALSTPSDFPSSPIPDDSSEISFMEDEEGRLWAESFRERQEKGLSESSPLPFSSLADETEIKSEPSSSPLSPVDETQIKIESPPSSLLLASPSSTSQADNASFPIKTEGSVSRPESSPSQFCQRCLEILYPNTVRRDRPGQG